MTIRKVFYKIGEYGRMFSSIIDLVAYVRVVIYSGYIGSKFRKCGEHLSVKPYLLLLQGSKYITVGDNVWIGKGVQLGAFSKSRSGQVFQPNITIGSNTSIGDYSHITCINQIRIGKNVLMGKNILISDNSHGNSLPQEVMIPPISRPLYSKGSIFIDDNVWIGEKATILPGIHIGKGAIIGASSVVTKDVPENTVVAGNPAHIVKTIHQQA